MQAVKMLCVVILFQFLAVPAHAGANTGGRIWVSWDRGGLVTDLNVVQFDQQDFYVHIDGAPDVAALGFQLMFNVDGDSTIALTTAEPDSQVGWPSPPRPTPSSSEIRPTTGPFTFLSDMNGPRSGT
ncbi:MAG: hypothetical protein ACKOEC_22480 [Acidimicrobiia bacterium]